MDSSLVVRLRVARGAHAMTRGRVLSPELICRKEAQKLKIINHPLNGASSPRLPLSALGPLNTDR
ncbi:MAG TPA: hypothetical protein VIK53_13770 [Verrucomicrobiae bacterium]